jgi:hypothetical protein
VAAEVVVVEAEEEAVEVAVQVQEVAIVQAAAAAEVAIVHPIRTNRPHRHRTPQLESILTTVLPTITTAIPTTISFMSVLIMATLMEL